MTLFPDQALVTPRALTGWLHQPLTPSEVAPLLLASVDRSQDPAPGTTLPAALSLDPAGTLEPLDHSCSLPKEAPALARAKRIDALEPRLLDLLRKKVAKARFSHRELERRLNLSHGTVGNLLKGLTALKIHHLDLFAQVFECSPDDLLLEALEIPPPRIDVALATLVADHVVARLLCSLRTE